MLRLKTVKYPAGNASREETNKRRHCVGVQCGIQLILCGIMQLATALQVRHLQHVSQKDEGHQVAEQLILHGAWQRRLSQQPPGLPEEDNFRRLERMPVGIF